MMDLMFKFVAGGLLVFTGWIVYVFYKEWAPLYKNKEDKSDV